MKKNTLQTLLRLLVTLFLLISLVGCSAEQSAKDTTEKTAEDESAEVIDNSRDEQSEEEIATETVSIEKEDKEKNASLTLTTAAYAVIDNSDLFTERDLTQVADLSEAVYYTVSDNAAVTISKEGVYVFSGSAENYQIIVEAEESDKVQIVLDNVTISNTNDAVIYVKSADKVFVTTTSTENSLSVSGSFHTDGDTNIDAVIFSKADLTLNGTGTLSITSSDNGITSKDDLKVTGGTYIIKASGHALEGKDSVRIYDGNFTITASSDGIHAENSEDTSNFISIGILFALRCSSIFLLLSKPVLLFSMPAFFFCTGIYLNQSPFATPFYHASKISAKIWLTLAGSAFPCIAFMVCPTKKPIAFFFPLL